MRSQTLHLCLLLLGLMALSGCARPGNRDRGFIVSATARPYKGGLEMDIVRPASLKGTTFLLSPIEPHTIEKMSGKTWLLQLRDKTVVDLLRQADHIHGYHEHVRRGADPLKYDAYSLPHLRLSDLAAPPIQIDPPSPPSAPASLPKN